MDGTDTGHQHRSHSPSNHHRGDSPASRWRYSLVLPALSASDAWAQAAAPASDSISSLILMLIVIVIVTGVGTAFYLFKERPKREEERRKQEEARLSRELRELNKQQVHDHVDKCNPAVFISYRRTESADIVGRMSDRLADRFGTKSVFKDVDSIPMGSDFRKDIREAVSKSNVMLVVVGKDWLGATSDDSGRRIDDPRDYPRMEVAAALQKEITLIPVLVGGATMPAPDELPEDIREFAYRNKAEVRPDPDFQRDVSDLIQGIENAVEARRSTTV